MTRLADKARRDTARKSTGPRSTRGKRRSAQNALRHGLSIPLRLDPAEKPRIQKLAHLIVSEAKTERLQQLAEEISEVQLELMRVRRLRHSLLQDPVIVEEKLSGKEFNAVLRAAMGRSSTTTSQVPENLGDLLKPKELSLTSAEKLDRLSTELSRLDRYERRALSRRKFLIREYDLLTPRALSDEV